MKKYITALFLAIALAIAPAQAGLETGTYVADLVSSNPLGSDGKAQGDDHLRLVKSVLQATFPNADRAFNLSQAAEWSDVVATETTSRALVTGDLGKILLVDPTTGAVALTLPDPGVVLTGWGIVIKRSVTHANGVTITPFGAEAIDGQAKSITLDIINDTVVLRTDGTNWFVWARSSYVESNRILAGAADTYTLTTGRTIAAYYDGLEIKAEINLTNTGASTLNVDTLGADAIEWPDGSAVISGDLPIGAKATFTHDGTNWQLLSVTAPVATQAGIQNQTYTYAVDSGAADAYIIALSRAPPSYTVGQLFLVKITNANTGASTINVNSLGVKNIFNNRTRAALLGEEMAANSGYFLYYDGTQFLLLNPGASAVDVQVFNSDDTWTKPSGVKSVHVVIIAGGGSGGREQTGADNATGAGGGGAQEFTIDADLLGATEAVTVGLGGAEVTVDGNGNDGGDSSFGSWGTAKGGVKGVIAVAAAAGGDGGDGSDNALAAGSYVGGSGASDAVGGASIYGGGAGGGVDDNSDNAGGPSDLGGGGGAGEGNFGAGTALGGVSKRSGNGGKNSTTESERDGVAPGGGGGAFNGSGNSGAGAPGRITVTSW